jgi:hypothetical protein
MMGLSDQIQHRINQGGERAITGADTIQCYFPLGQQWHQDLIVYDIHVHSCLKSILVIN